MSNSEAHRKLLEKTGARATIGSILFNDFWNGDDRLANVIQNLISKGTLKLDERGKLVVTIVPGNLQTPWYFIKRGMFRDCLLWHQIYFEYFNFVPTGCQNCWKCMIVTHTDPSKQTVLDLFKLRDMLVSLNMPSKCGMDIRDFTPHRYAGFVYAESFRQGLQYYQLIKAALADNKLRNAKVVLKRGCTEMELRFPDSSKWEHTQYTFDLQQKLDALIGATETPEGPQDDLTVQTVFRKWILRAHGIGDPTWRDALMYEGYEDPGERLFIPPVTYHDKTEEELQQMLPPEQFK
jgi:hypothetical protein